MKSCLMAWVCWETSQAESRVWLGQNSQLPFQTSLPLAAPYGFQEEEKNELPRNSFGTVQVEQLCLHFGFSQQFITLIFLSIFQLPLGFAAHGELSCHRGKACAARHEAKKEPHRYAWGFLRKGITKHRESSESQQTPLSWLNGILLCHIHWVLKTRGGTGGAPMSCLTGVLCTNGISMRQQKVHPWDNNVLLSRKS